MTTRGFKEKECEQVANWMCDVLDDLQDTQRQKRIREQVLRFVHASRFIKKEAMNLCQKFPVFHLIIHL